MGIGFRMARPEGIEPPTLCLEGISGASAHVGTRLEAIVNSVLRSLFDESIQAYLSRYALQYPLQRLRKAGPVSPPEAGPVDWVAIAPSH
jgi:hypothetical protein